MKKLQKKLLLLDLENTSSSYDRKVEMLNNIIMYYLDEDNKEDNPDSDNKTMMKYDENLYDFEEDFEEDIFEENTNTKQENTTEEKEPIVDEPIKPKVEELPSDIKNIYRKIMMITHPDKTKGKNKKEYDEYYRNAVSAKNKNEISEIIYIAYKLNIEEVYNIEINNFNKIKYKIAQLNLESKGIENSPFWIWYYSDNEEIRKVMDLHIKKFKR